MGSAIFDYYKYGKADMLMVRSSMFDDDHIPGQPGAVHQRSIRLVHTRQQYFQFYHRIIPPVILGCAHDSILRFFIIAYICKLSKSLPKSPFFMHFSVAFV